MTFFTKKVCRTCGSAEVQADAYAMWNTDTQEWELVGDPSERNAVCVICEGATRIEEAPLEGDALIAARGRWLALDNGWLPSDDDTALAFCAMEGLDPFEPIEEERS